MRKLLVYICVALIAVTCHAAGYRNPHYIDEMVEFVQYSGDGSARINQEPWVVHRFTLCDIDVPWCSSSRKYARVHFDGIEQREIDRIARSGMARIRGTVAGWRNGEAIIIVDGVQVLRPTPEPLFD